MQYTDLINVQVRFCTNVVKNLFNFLKSKTDLFYYDEECPQKISFKEESEYKLDYSIWIIFTVNVKDRIFEISINSNSLYNPFGENNCIISTYPIKSEKDFGTDLEQWIVDTFLYELYERI